MKLVQELQGSRLSEQKQKRHFSAVSLESLSKGKAASLFLKATNPGYIHNLDLQPRHIHTSIIVYATGSPFLSEPEAILTPHSARVELKTDFLKAGRIARGPAQRRSSRLFSASRSSLITVQRSRRAVRKMLICQDPELRGLCR